MESSFADNVYMTWRRSFSLRSHMKISYARNDPKIPLSEFIFLYSIFFVLPSSMRTFTSRSFTQRAIVDGREGEEAFSVI